MRLSAYAAGYARMLGVSSGCALVCCCCLVCSLFWLSGFTNESLSSLDLPLLYAMRAVLSGFGCLLCHRDSAGLPVWSVFDRCLDGIDIVMAALLVCAQLRRVESCWLEALEYRCEACFPA